MNQIPAVDDSILPISNDPLLDSVDFYARQQQGVSVRCPPPPVRNWDNAQYQPIHIAPTPCHSSLNVTVRAPFVPSAPVGAMAGPTHDAAYPASDDEGYQIVGARRQKKSDQARARGKPLKGVEKRQPFLLYVTYCHPDAMAEDIESYFTENFE